MLKQNWMWIVVLVLVAWEARQCGVSQSEAKRWKEKVTIAEAKADSLMAVVVKTDREVVRLRAGVDSARARVVVIDKTVQPQIDSAVVALGATLDSAQKVMLKQIESGYESRLAYRDSAMMAMSRLIAKQDTAIAQRDEQIVAMRSLQQTTQAAWQSAEKRNNRSNWRVLGAIAATLAIVVVAK